MATLGAEADNIAENVPKLVSLGRKNTCFGSDHGGEWGALLYNLIGTCKLNGVSQSYLRMSLTFSRLADKPGAIAPPGGA